MIARSTGLSVGPMVVSIVGIMVGGSVSGAGVGVGVTEGAMAAMVTEGLGAMVTEGVATGTVLLCPIARDTMLTSASHLSAILVSAEISASTKRASKFKRHIGTQTYTVLCIVCPSTPHYFLVVP